MSLIELYKLCIEPGFQHRAVELNRSIYRHARVEFSMQKPHMKVFVFQMRIWIDNLPQRGVLLLQRGRHAIAAGDSDKRIHAIRTVRHAPNLGRRIATERVELAFGIFAGERDRRARPSASRKAN